MQGEGEDTDYTREITLGTKFYRLQFTFADELNISRHINVVVASLGRFLDQTHFDSHYFLCAEIPDPQVADFGFSRDVMANNIYERKSEGRLPIRWMAPEALYDNVYTT